MADLKALYEARANAFSQAKELLDGVENRALSAEESAKYDAINADIDRMGATISEHEALAEKRAAADEARSRYADILSAEAETRAEVPEVETAVSADAIFRSARSGDVFDFDGAEYRVQSKIAAVSGGAGVPTDFYSKLVQYQVADSAILGMNPTFIDTETGTNLEVPRVTAYGAAVQKTEAASGAAADDSFSKATLGAFTYLVYVQVSKELVADEGFGLEDYIARDAARKLTNKYGALLVTGTGTAEPQGLVTGSSAAVTAASASLTWDNMIDLQMSLLPQYRRNGAWVASDATIAALRKLKDGELRYLYDIATVPGQPDTIFGRPVIADPNVAAIGTTAKSVVFCDPAGYWVRRAGGVEFMRSDEFAFDKGLITYRAIVRLDGQLVDANSAKHIVHA